MNTNSDTLIKKIFMNQTSAHAFTALILFALGMIFSIITPVGASKWYHVFLKLMMFMFIVMSFIFSVVAIIKGLTVILNKESEDNRNLTLIAIVVSAIIILILVISLYSNPYLIDVFGLTKKTRIYTPNIIQSW